MKLAMHMLLLLGWGCISAPNRHASTMSATAAVAATPHNIEGVNNFARISAVLYRGDQPSRLGFQTLKKMGIKTIVNLRSFHGDSSAINGLGFRYFHIYAKAWHPEDEDVVAFLKIAEEPQNQPVFVHCAQGSDRTGYCVAAYRMVDQNWTAADAISEMRRFGFHEIWSDIPDYLNDVDAEAIQAKIRISPMPVVRMIR